MYLHLSLRSYCRAKINREITFTAYANISQINPSKLIHWGGRMKTDIHMHILIYILNMQKYAHLHPPTQIPMGQCHLVS